MSNFTTFQDKSIGEEIWLEKSKLRYVKLIQAGWRKIDKYYTFSRALTRGENVHTSPLCIRIRRGLSWSACLIDKKLTVKLLYHLWSFVKRNSPSFFLFYARSVLGFNILFPSISEGIATYNFIVKRLHWRLMKGAFSPRGMLEREVFQFHNKTVVSSAKSNINHKDKYNLNRFVNMF